jgi:hypothetical protein
VSDDDAAGDDMSKLGRHLDGDPLALDQGTAERLLAGTVDPADAPPAYAAVAEVLAAAAGPPQPDELIGEVEAVARFNVRRRAAERGRRRAPVRRHLARLVLVSAVVLGMLSAGGAGFATGVLPRTGQWLGQTIQSLVGPDPAIEAPPRTGPGSPTSTPFAGRDGPAAAATTPRSLQGSTPGIGLGSTAAADELCKAWEAGKGAKLDAAALEALAGAAGGSGNIPAYCRAVSRADQQGTDQESADPQRGTPKSGNGKGNGHGKTSSSGQGGGSGEGQAAPGAARQAAPAARQSAQGPGAA